MEYLKPRMLPSWFYILTLIFLGGSIYQGVMLIKLEAIHHAIAYPSSVNMDANTREAALFAKTL